MYLLFCIVIALFIIALIFPGSSFQSAQYFSGKNYPNYSAQPTGIKENPLSNKIVEFRSEESLKKRAKNFLIESEQRKSNELEVLGKRKRPLKPTKEELIECILLGIIFILAVIFQS